VFLRKPPPLPPEITFKEQRIVLRRIGHAKNLRLMYNAKQKCFQLTLPSYATKSNIDEFLERSLPWLEKKVKSQISAIKLDHGQTVPILGTACKIYFQKDIKKKVIFNLGVISVLDPQEQFLPLLQKGIQTKALEFLTETSKTYAKLLDVKITKISIRDTHSRWGSCSSSGNLSYSWRLIFAQQQVTEYVCAHEVSHLIHMNHSQAFWKTVENLSPGYKKHKAWLRQHGRQLFLYDF
jgi:predicted metal-dependent hydrolase